MADSPLLVMTHVARRFGRIRAVEDASLAVPRGAIVGVLGESGSGKSTLARLATGLLRPDSGEIRYAGAPLHPPSGLLRGLLAPAPARRRIAMVFQDPASSFDPRWSIGRSIAEPIVAFGLRIGRTGVKNRAIELMASVGLPEQMIDERPTALSLGQVQRAAIARALAGEPDLMVCDEAVSALDLSVQALVLNTLSDVRRRDGISLLFISHDVGVVRHMSDLVAVMLRGRVVEFAVADQVFARPLHPYTQFLIESVPELGAPRIATKLPAADYVPPTAAAGQCAFAPRCSLAVGRCFKETPPLVDVDGTAVACHVIASST